MELPIPPRFVVGIIGILVAAYLGIVEVLRAETVAVIIVGVLVALGAYQMPSPSQRNGRI